MVDIPNVDLDTDLLPPEAVDLEFDEEVLAELARIDAADDASVPAIEAKLLEQTDNRGEDAGGGE